MFRCGRLGSKIVASRPFREGRNRALRERLAAMQVNIVPIEESHVDGFHRAIDSVARERRYLAFLEAPPLESTRAFVLGQIKRGHPQFVAVAAGEVVGWCDITAKDRPIYAHAGVLGVALLPPFRGRGL